jgi:hypothetical protein
MKNKKLKLVQVEASKAPGGAGEGCAQVEGSGEEPSSETLKSNGFAETRRLGFGCEKKPWTCMHV